MSNKDIIGNHNNDPFYDSYQQEADTCCDIIDLVNKATTDYVTVVINKSFLKKIVRSHIIFIREIEKGL